MSWMRKGGDLITYLRVPLFIGASKRGWLVGRHSKVHFWMDNWLGDPLIDLVKEKSALQLPLDSVVCDVYSEAKGLDIPTFFQASHPDVASEIEKVVVSTDLNSLVWTYSLDGVLTCKSPYNYLFEVRSSVFWGKQIWASYIPHSHFVLIWRLFHGKIPTNIVLRARCYISLSRYRFCCAAEKDLRHLFLDCPFVCGLWDVVSSTFSHKFKLDVFWVVWFLQNQATFEGGKPIFIDVFSLIWRSVHEADSLQFGTMKNSVDELQTLQRLHVSGHPSKAPRILEVNWCPPLSGCLKVNMDGAAFGSSDLVGCARGFLHMQGFR
ncbi:hypothetical protein Ddye_017743 [Dipteronia dyeriana]|uniref:Reverse transcriptase zinc-binding domain-containing protein n=1 Tax=Dipteronia dyeriana TaxID=168575 RepID=A0AAD9UA46_9ROSI|nr:hypothetical protein Ddye_017743 [Dipteronia dyeriana]